MILNKEDSRLKNFIMMLEDEVVQDILKEVNRLNYDELRVEIRRPETRALIKVIILKVLMNLHNKRSLQLEFITSIMGITTEDIYDWDNNYGKDTGV